MNIERWDEMHLVWQFIILFMAMFVGLSEGRAFGVQYTEPFDAVMHACDNISPLALCSNFTTHGKYAVCVCWRAHCADSSVSLCTPPPSLRREQGSPSKMETQRDLLIFDISGTLGQCVSCVRMCCVYARVISGCMFMRVCVCMHVYACMRACIVCVQVCVACAVCLCVVCMRQCIRTCASLISCAHIRGTFACTVRCLLRYVIVSVCLFQ